LQSTGHGCLDPSGLLEMGWKVIQFLTNFPLSEEEEFKMLVVTYQAPFDNGSVWDSNTPHPKKTWRNFLPQSHPQYCGQKAQNAAIFTSAFRGH
jgi:hypothetical protein